LIYTIGYAPPISLLGRLATGRLVIPGYDVVFAAPLAVAMVAWLLPEAAVGIAVPSLIAIPVTAAIAVWLSLALPPRRAVWHYTGQHRIAYRFRAAIYDRSNASKVRR
jgi:hypothetical protein